MAQADVEIDDKGLMTGKDWLEFVASILMAVAMILTAYSAYEATRWGGVQLTAFATSGALRTEANTLVTEGVTQVSYDASTFGNLALAFREEDLGDPSAMNEALLYADELTRDEFKPVLQEWLELDPRNNPNAPGTPLDLPSYSNAKLDEAKGLLAEADIAFEEAKNANQTGDDYILGTIFFASVLFFTGIRIKRLETHWIVIAFAVAGLSAGILRIATLPFH
jgi:hypothetical protein